VDAVYRKLYLSAEESARFAPGAGPKVIDVDGWRVGLGICMDTGTSRQVLDTAALGMHIYAAGLVMLPAERAEQQRRARRIATHLGVFVAFAGFAGPTGSGYEQTAGCSGIWDRDGSALATAGAGTGEIARAELPGE
jgi:predicted amidohydrolase